MSRYVEREAVEQLSDFIKQVSYTGRLTLNKGTKEEYSFDFRGSPWTERIRLEGRLAQHEEDCHTCRNCKLFPDRYGKSNCKVRKWLMKEIKEHERNP